MMPARRQIVFAFFLLVLVTIGAVAWAILNEPPQPTRLGFIRSVSTNGNYGILFDEVERLTGREAQDAAIAARECTEATRHTCLPDDSVIRNLSTETEPYEFWVNVAIAVRVPEDGGVREVQLSRQDFERIINDEHSPWRNQLYEITVKNNLVNSVREVE